MSTLRRGPPQDVVGIADVRVVKPAVDVQEPLAIQGSLRTVVCKWPDPLVRSARSAAMADDAKPPRDVTPTYAEEGGALWKCIRRGGQTEVQRLTTFTARIVEERLLDDGIEARREFEIEATVDGRTIRFVVPAADFMHVTAWAHKHLGARAVVSGAVTSRDATVAEAIQLFSTPVQRRLFAHTGWREIAPNQWAYLSAAGALGADGLVPEVEVALAPPLDRYFLDGTGDEATGVKASLAVLDAFPLRITAPLLGTVWRSVLGPSRSVLSLVGTTGTGKSELAGLAMRHFGPALDANHLPASWSSTAVALAALASEAADTLLFVDDYAPTPATAFRMARTAEEVIRGIGNGASRLRGQRDGTRRPETPPRGSIASTGEDTPLGASLLGRMLTVEVAPGEFALSDFTPHQSAAARGEFAAGMAGYVRWLARRLPEHRAQLETRIGELRKEFEAGGAHSRAPSAVAELFAAWELWSRFAVDGGHLTIDDARSLLQRVRMALDHSLKDQAILQATSDPCKLFLQALASAVASGAAHLAGPDGSAPNSPTRWGWREDVGPFADTVRPLGSRIGWVTDEGLWLEPTASLATARRMAQDSGEPLTCTARALHKRLYEEGRLASSAVTSQRRTYAVRKMVDGLRVYVLHLPLDALSAGIEAAQVEQFVAGLDNLVEQAAAAA